MVTDRMSSEQQQAERKIETVASWRRNEELAYIEVGDGVPLSSLIDGAAGFLRAEG